MRSWLMNPAAVAGGSLPAAGMAHSPICPYTGAQAGTGLLQLLNRLVQAEATAGGSLDAAGLFQTMRQAAVADHAGAACRKKGRLGLAGTSPTRHLASLFGSGLELALASSICGRRDSYLPEPPSSDKPAEVKPLQELMRRSAALLLPSKFGPSKFSFTHLHVAQSRSGKGGPARSMASTL